MHKKRGLFTTFIFGILLLFVCKLSNAFTVPPESPRPIPVSVALFINDITAINAAVETVEFETTLYLRWKDPRLVFDPAKAKTKTKYFTGKTVDNELEKIWAPYLRIIETRGPIVVKDIALSISYEGEVNLKKRMTLNIETHIDMRQFPFDDQKITITVQPFTEVNTPVKFDILKKHQGISGLAHLAEWKIRDYSNSVTQNLTTTKIPQYHFSVHYDRRSTYYVLKILIPLVVMVLLSFAAFWLPMENLINRMRYVLTALLTIVAFQWTIASDTPKVSYITFFDALVLTSYITLATTILVLIIIRQLKESTGLKIQSVFRFLFPTVYTIALFSIIYHFFG